MFTTLGAQNWWDQDRILLTLNKKITIVQEPEARYRSQLLDAFRFLQERYQNNIQPRGPEYYPRKHSYQNIILIAQNKNITLKVTIEKDTVRHQYLKNWENPEKLFDDTGTESDETLTLLDFFNDSVCCDPGHWGNKINLEQTDPIVQDLGVKKEEATNKKQFRVSPYWRMSSMVQAVLDTKSGGVLLLDTPSSIQENEPLQEFKKFASEKCDQIIVSEPINYTHLDSNMPEEYYDLRVNNRI